jgi:signal transduction histidine kinase
LIEAARHAFRLFEISLVMRGIKSEIEIPKDLFADVPFNVAALALATLVGNAKDAIQSKGGTIRIEANRSGEDIICRVIDDGTGIHSEVRSKIFEPKSKTKRYGTGLGLFLTAHSLSDNASSISLTKSDETGTIFTIRFPLGKES